MPSRTSVAQQSGVLLPQVEGPRHSTVSSASHVDVHTGTSVVRSAQQVSPPVHGTWGHVGPPSPGVPLLEPELLALPLLEPPPELVPPELLAPELPDPELPPEDEALASLPVPAPPPLLLPEQLAVVTAQSRTADAEAARVRGRAARRCIGVAHRSRFRSAPPAELLLAPRTSVQRGGEGASGGAGTTR